MKKIVIAIGMILIEGGQVFSMSDPYSDIIISLDPEVSVGTRQLDSEKQVVQLNDGQKQAIAQAVKHLFDAQQASTVTYDAILQAMQAALGSSEVRTSGERVIADIKEWVRLFVKNLALTNEQALKIRDALESVRSLVAIQEQYMRTQVLDEAMRVKVDALQKGLARHIMAMAQSVDRADMQEFLEKKQTYFLQILHQLLEEMLAVVPASTSGSGTTSLGEPFVPEMVLVDERVN
ncbi:MAG: hypothetical protein NTX86_03080 [Candidatus Dependentiae bacterium]|nr:hypothetical protein [Candidatus Dependentiae bacterium]